MLKTLINAAKLVGLPISIMKTKCIRFGITDTDSYYINDEELGDIDVFHLGSIITKTSGTSTDVQSIRYKSTTCLRDVGSM